MKTDAERILGDTCRQDAMNKLSKIFTDFLMDTGFFKTCLNCEHWIEGPSDNRKQICSKFNARPPTDVIVCGCEHHSENIPF